MNVETNELIDDEKMTHLFFSKHQTINIFHFDHSPNAFKSIFLPIIVITEESLWFRVKHISITLSSCSFFCVCHFLHRYFFLLLQYLYSIKDHSRIGTELWFLNQNWRENLCCLFRWKEESVRLTIQTAHCLNNRSKSYAHTHTEEQDVGEMKCNH